MPKRGENIHKRKDGRWEGRYKKGCDSTGEVLYRSVYGKTYREVKNKLTLAISQQNSVFPSEHGEKVFKEVLFLWMENNCIRQKKATAYKYQNLISTHIVPALGEVKLSQITSTVINSFLMEKLQTGRLDGKGGLSPAYVRSITFVINSALKFAVDEQMCQPLKSPIYKPISPKKELSILSLEEQHRLEFCLHSEQNPTKVGILISLHAGLRIGEVCALTWDDIDLENRIIHVRHTIARVKNMDARTQSITQLIVDTPKTKASARDIPILSALMPVLLEQSKVAVSKYVVSEIDSFVSPRTYEYRYHQILKECGLEEVNYHVLRHTFATRCIEAGVDVKSLSEILGHSNVSITLNTYVHSSIDMKRSQLEKLNTFTL